MAAELINAATSEKLAGVDWMKNIEICELVAHDQRYPTKLFFILSPCGIVSFRLIIDQCHKTWWNYTQIFPIFNSYLLDFTYGTLFF